MPELPEVETIYRKIKPWLFKHTVLQIIVRNLHLRWPIDNKIIHMKNEYILNVQRRAKYLILEFKEGCIIIHFGMSGSISILSNAMLPQKHDHIDLIISNGCIIRYTDPRRFGFWIWKNNFQTNSLLSQLGPEPLSDQFNGQWLYEKTRNKYTPIKPWLMNPKIISGIGNVYANESLFVAKIWPGRIICSLNKIETMLLVNSIKTVLLHAIKYNGTTLQNFKDPEGKIGQFVYKLQVYGRETKPCLVCQTTIQKIKYNGRSTFFCPQCQPICNHNLKLNF